MTTYKYIKGKEISEMEISVYKNILDHTPVSKTTIKQLIEKLVIPFALIIKIH